MQVGDWVVPMNSKDIVKIEGIEDYEGITIIFTNDGRAWETSDLLTVHQAAAYENLIG